MISVERIWTVKRLAAAGGELPYQQAEADPKEWDVEVEDQPGGVMCRLEGLLVNALDSRIDEVDQREDSEHPDQRRREPGPAAEEPEASEGDAGANQIAKRNLSSERL